MRPIVVLLALVLTSCSSETVIIEEEEWYEDEELGYEVDDFSWEEVEGEQSDTHLRRSETATIKIAGQPDHQVRVSQYDYYIDVDDPKSGTQLLEIEDLTSGNYRVFTFAPRLSAILIESDNTDIEIVKNPDGSYTVGDQPAANGRAAVKLLQENPIFGDASQHGFLLAYAMAQKATPWTSLMKSLVGPSPAPSFSRAEVGAVCERFQDFCDCAACFKTGQLDSCKRCPQ